MNLYANFIFQFLWFQLVSSYNCCEGSGNSSFFLSLVTMLPMFIYIYTYTHVYVLYVCMMLFCITVLNFIQPVFPLDSLKW